MHPDQFTLINSIKYEIFERSKNEFKYHAQILDLMKLDTSVKIQIHVGGAYGDNVSNMNVETSKLLRNKSKVEFEHPVE